MKRTQIRLIGVPQKHQGTHDSLCAYYAAAMMLTALRPELEERFEAGDVREDPLFGHYPRGRRRIDALVAEWIAAGAHLDRLARALDRVCGRATRFTYAQKPRGAATLEFLRARIDEGLPTVLGWESREMGLHTVCVVGYEDYATGGRWLRVHDPAQLQDVLEWAQLERLATKRLELIHCVAHTGVRPDKMTAHRNARGHIRATMARWDPRAGAYAPLV
jgi:hypothetical protein